VCCALAAVACTWSSLSAHHAVLRFNLEEMVVTADRVFIGECTAVEPAREAVGGGTLPVTRYTFSVQQVLKGDVTERLTFTQIGYPPRPALKGEPSSHGLSVRPGMQLHGAADYGVGDRLLMLLIPNYQNGRFTYPVGLDQGAFLLEDDGSGGTTVRNNLNNLGLFTAPYNRTRLSADDARVIQPDALQPVVSAVQLSPAARSLPDKRGALPLAPMLELIQRIHAAHLNGGRR
jgi:hypothetical protein